MRIWPDHHSVDDFIITVGRKELENLKEGLRQIVHLRDSPWGKGADEAMAAALKANHDYRFTKYESDPQTA